MRTLHAYPGDSSSKKVNCSDAIYFNLGWQRKLSALKLVVSFPADSYRYVTIMVGYITLFKAKGGTKLSTMP